MKRDTIRRSLLPALLLGSAACGGGGGGGSGQAQRAIAAAQVTLAFPTVPVTTDAESIAIRGSIDLAAPVDAVRVNGLSATSVDGFATFSADVPLSTGVHDVVVEVDRNGTTTTVTFAQRVRRVEPVLLAAPDVDFDAAHGRFLVLDPISRALLAMKAGTSDRALLSDAGHGNGQLPISAIALAVSADGETAFVVDRDDISVFQVDLASGDRSILSGPADGTGELFELPVAIALDARNQRLLVSDALLDLVLAVDLTTGDRTELSSSTVGSGKTFQSVGAIALDPKRRRAVVVDARALALVAVDLATGNRSTLSDATHGTGAAFTNPGGLRYDAVRDVFVVGETGPSALVQVDASSGDRTTLTSNRVGRGIALQTPGEFAIDAKAGTIELVDVVGPALLAIDEKSGDRRRVVAALTVGTGAPFVPETPLALDAASGRAWCLAVQPDPSVIEVDLATGARTTLSDATHGSGPDFSQPVTLAFEAERDRLLVADLQGDVLFAVSTQDGSRSILSQEAVVPAEPLHATHTIVIDAAHERALLVQTDDLILAVDLSDGTRSTLSFEGGGPLEMESIVDATLDAAHGRLLVDDAVIGLVAVALGDGTRSFISGSLGVDTRIAADEALSRVFFTVGDLAEAVEEFDPATGNVATISTRLSRDGGRGPSFSTPKSIQFDETNRVAFVLDDDTLALYQVDVVSGDRVLIGR